VSILISELIMYGSANHQETDSGTQGGAITTSVKLELTDISATGTVEVYSQIVNCTDFALNAEARTQFYDVGQAPSEPVSAWKRFSLPPRTSNTYRETSIGTQNASYYMVELRETK